MEVFEKSETVDVEVRAYVSSLVSAVSLLRACSTAATNRNRSAETAQPTMDDMCSETMRLLV